MANISKLEEIQDLRTVWKNEARDFTPWLSQDDNIALLSEAIGLDITVNETESSVGKFNVDIFAYETGTDRKIIIENQLENTNHDHLGKLITYATGKSADVIIWVVKHAREEHKAAIEWLNNHTDGNIGFFLCEIKLFRIGNSEPAVKFEVIEKPYSLPTYRRLTNMNYYLGILDFLNNYGGKPYQKPETAPNPEIKNQMSMIKQSAIEASNMMYEVCGDFAASNDLVMGNTVRKWLCGNGIVIRDYFWAQLKYPNSKSPISISIFAAHNQYRIALELDDKHTTPKDYQAYKKYLDLPIDTSLLKFFKASDSTDERSKILNLTKQQVKEQLNDSNDWKERVQLSYFISRIDETTNSERSADKFYDQINEGLKLLLPYYKHVMNSCDSENSER